MEPESARETFDPQWLIVQTAPLLPLALEGHSKLRFGYRRMEMQTPISLHQLILIFHHNMAIRPNTYATVTAEKGCHELPKQFGIFHWLNEMTPLASIS